MEGNSKLEASRSTAQLAGPGLAGTVIQVLSVQVAIPLDAISFLISGVLIGLIRRREDPPARAGRASLLTEMREGLRVVFGNRLLWAIAGCTGTHNFFSSAFFALYILFVTRDLGLAPAAIGAVFSVANVAGLAGAIVAGRLGGRLGVGPVIVGSALVGGLGLIPAVLATRTTAVPLLVLSGLLGSFSGTVYNINQVSLRQAITPDRLQGRMNATMRFLVRGQCRSAA